MRKLVMQHRILIKPYVTEIIPFSTGIKEVDKFVESVVDDEELRTLLSI